MLRFDLDPTPLKAGIIGILLFLESFIGSLIVICQKGVMPTLLEALTAFFIALLVAVTYLLAFVRASE